MTTLSDVVEAINSSDVITDGAKESAFLKVTPNTPLTHKGASLVTITSEATLVVEGGTKPAAQEAAKLAIVPAKFVAAHIATEEALLASDVLENAITEAMPKSFGADLDKYLLGIKTNPVGSTLMTFGGITATEVNDWATLVAAFGEVASGNPTAIVATTGFITALAGTVNAGGFAMFPELLSATPTLLGLPVYKVASASNVAVVGDFNNARGGAVMGESNSSVRIHREGTYDEVNLLETNQVLLLAEGWYGYGYGDVDNFVRLVVGDPEA